VGVCGWLGRAGLRGLAFRLPPGAYLPACWVGKGLGDMELFLRPGFGRAGRLGGRSAAGVVVWMGGHSESRVKGGSEAGLFLRV
jgi:hypothetical protein